MKAIRIIFILVVIIVAIVFIGALFMPSHLHVEKSMVMKAEPEVIFEQVNCFDNWEPWMPWREMIAEQTVEGPECGVGSKQVWKNEKGSSGSQTIVESREYSYIKTELDLMDQGTATSEWRFEPADEGTLVTWNLTSDAPYPIGRWVTILFIEPEVDKSYDQGLTSLNDYTKDMKPHPKWKTGEIRVETLKSQRALATKTKVAMEEMDTKMEECFDKVNETIQKYNLQMTGAPFAIWHEWNEDGESTMECGIPVSKPVKITGDVRVISTYRGKVVTALHAGSYETSGNTWEALDKYIEENNLEVNGAPWEVYLADPSNEPDPEKYRTQIYYPVK